jgi:hemerythrin-like domain-containing protein
MDRPELSPTDVRRALLAEHAQLRELLDQLEEVAGRVRTGLDVPARLGRLVDSFRQTLETHNENEETFLEPMLRELDAWGPIRADRLLREHVDEHIDMLSLIDSPDPEMLASTIPVFAELLRAHIMQEEKSFLSAELLHDDIITTGPTS